MKRRDFILNGGRAGVAICLGGLCGAGCGSAAYFAQTNVQEQKIAVPKSEFQYLKKEEVRTRSHVFVRLPQSGFPVCLYKTGTGYTACLLECTHRGCEVEVHGSRYVCPCHGSEFSPDGAVLEGPAERPLKIFKTTEDETHIYVWLA
jgi:cytochrome b6-f complex iron-sulfur subunit